MRDSLKCKYYTIWTLGKTLDYGDIVKLYLSYFIVVPYFFKKLQMYQLKLISHFWMHFVLSHFIQYIAIKPYSEFTKWFRLISLCMESINIAFSFTVTLDSPPIANYMRYLSKVSYNQLIANVQFKPSYLISTTR